MQADKELEGIVEEIIDDSTKYQKRISRQIKESLLEKYGVKNPLELDNTSLKVYIAEFVKDCKLANLDDSIIFENINIVPGISVTDYNGVVNVGSPNPNDHISNAFVIYDADPSAEEWNGYRMQIIYGSTTNQPTIIPPLSQPACSTIDELRIMLEQLPENEIFLDAIETYLEPVKI